jgi:hypothetical protein
MLTNREIRCLLPVIWCVLILSTTAWAIEFDDDGCPRNSYIVYSPFKAWFNFYPGADNQMCWTTASCLFIKADESRKQQFAATALVMGLIPLTLKDIAWPHRRILQVSQRPSVLVEIIVRALGLIPDIQSSRDETRLKLVRSSRMAAWAWDQPRLVLRMLVALSTIGLATAYCVLAIVEIYSKRSCLGCVYPIFVVSWHLAALLPAAIHTFSFSFRERKERKKLARIPIVAGEADRSSSSPLNPDPEELQSMTDHDKAALIGFQEAGNHSESISAIQGADETWLVQLIWAIYYIAGTLIFTSIVGVTVIELLTWVLVCCFVSFAAKMLALFILLSLEKIGRDQDISLRR